jgi:hypothetical protein
MVNFYALAITAICAGTLAYLLGASKEWERHLKTIDEFNDLASYSNDITRELSGLRAAGNAAEGSRHPSLSRRSHLQLVK